ncbi:hypothetical protein [Kitasatospora sp. HPMI-4]|uniref:hypothetical protein n=1 Tax=Kitasatospora sp. HPMI-4 TaxID=3448443 RepID=UPI003F1A5F78
MLSKRLVHSAVVCAVLAVGATACGGSKDKSATPATPASAPASAASSAGAVSGLAVDTLSGEQIMDKVKAAMSGLAAVKIDGTVVTDDGEMTVHLALDKKKNCAGSVANGGVGKVEILHNEAGTWIKPDDAYWKNIAVKEGSPQAGPMLAELFKGRYLTGAQNDENLKGMSDQICGMLEGLAQDDGIPSKATKGAAGTTNGIKTFSLTVVDDQSGASTLHIATEGQPYIVRMESASASEPGHLDFSDFNKPITVTAPPAENVIDYSVFQQKLKSA